MHCKRYLITHSEPVDVRKGGTSYEKRSNAHLASGDDLDALGLQSGREWARQQGKGICRYINANQIIRTMGGRRGEHGPSVSGAGVQNRSSVC